MGNSSKLDGSPAVLNPEIPSQDDTSGIADADGPTAEETVSVSTAFNGNSMVDADVTIVSSDEVYFSAHRHRLLTASSNDFGSLLPPRDMGIREECVLALPETSIVVNIVLHIIYGLSCGVYTPSLETLNGASRALRNYGVLLPFYATRGGQIYELLLAEAPRRPLQTFAIAAENNFEELAVAISPHLLPYGAKDIPDEIAQQAGPLYLKRLFCLREARYDLMRQIIVAPPYPHAPDRNCGPADRQGLSRAWTLAAAQLVWDFRNGAHSGGMACSKFLPSTYLRAIISRHVARRDQICYGLPHEPYVVHVLRAGLGRTDRRSRSAMVARRCE